jgi:hypothetical protein
VVLEREWSAMTYVKIVAWEEGQGFGTSQAAMMEQSINFPFSTTARGKEKYWR